MISVRIPSVVIPLFLLVSVISVLALLQQNVPQIVDIAKSTIARKTMIRQLLGMIQMMMTNENANNNANDGDCVIDDYKKVKMSCN